MGTRLASSLVCAFVCFGCGDDGASDAGGDTSTVDTGVIDTGAGADADATVSTTTINVRFVDPDGMPLSDVKVAVDTAAGRDEGISDAEGLLALPVRAEIGDLVSATNALEGYTILSRLDFELTDAGVGTGAEPVEVTLNPLEVPLGSRVMFTITATGVPAGAKLCASHGAGRNQNWSLCGEPDVLWRFDVPIAAIGDAVNVWLVDDTDTPIDFERVPIAAGETSVSVDFDGTFATTPEMRTVRLDFPDDPESPLVTATELPSNWQGWFVSWDLTTGQQWGIATNPQRDAGDLVVQVMLMPPPAGVEFRYGATAWAQLRSLHSVSLSSFMSDPGTTATMIGFPRITAGSSITDAFTFEAPAPIGGEELAHVLSFRNSGARTVWQIRSSATTISAPELPSTYDVDVTFPFAGAMGTAIVSSFTALNPDEVPAEERDFHNSLSAEVPITF